MFENAEDCLLNIIHDDVEIDLVLLIALCVEGMLELNDVRMLELLHYLQFSILIPLVLVNFFDGHKVIVNFVVSLVDHSE